MDRTPYGLHIVIVGSSSEEEVSQWSNSITPLLTPSVYNLLVLLDILEASHLVNPEKKQLLAGFELLMDSNLVRVGIVYNSFSLRLQIENILVKAGVKHFRFFHSDTPAFKRLAREWVVTGSIDESGG